MTQLIVAELVMTFVFGENETLDAFRYVQTSHYAEKQRFTALPGKHLVAELLDGLSIYS